jgi:hypothetical protein
MTKKNSDIIAGIVFFAFAGLLYIASGFMPTRTGGIAALNTGFYPRILAILLTVLSVLMVIEALRTQNTTKRESRWNSKTAFLRCSDHAGHADSLCIHNEDFRLCNRKLCFHHILDVDAHRQTRTQTCIDTGVSMGITAIIYIIFKMILSIPFPQGLLI